MNKRITNILTWLDHPVSSAPLATFRVVFGAVMVFSVVRYGYLGWIGEHFIDTKFTFKFYGFEWVQLLPPAGMYALHALMLLGALGVMLGLFYRLSAAVFFATFSYAWLIDLTYYLNHYYFVSIIAFLLILVPANRRFALDCRRRPGLSRLAVPRWTIFIFKLQIAIVYIYAGLAKINSDWLLEALPLKIWLPANDQIPVLGSLFAWHWAPWLFSWLGMLYDTTIVFWLSWARTRAVAYLSVIAFHGLTGLLFQIGVFPLVMIGATWIFFSEGFHERLLGVFGRFSARASTPPPTPIALPTGQAGINLRPRRGQMFVERPVFLYRWASERPNASKKYRQKQTLGLSEASIQLDFGPCATNVKPLRGLKLMPAWPVGRAMPPTPPQGGRGAATYTVDFTAYLRNAAKKAVNATAPLPLGAGAGVGLARAETCITEALRYRGLKLTAMPLSSLSNLKNTREVAPLPSGGGVGGGADTTRPTAQSRRTGTAPGLIALLSLHFAIQLLFPWRYLLYPGNLFWTEEGYRFSWRVMLMEKAGTATFFVRDSRTGREGAVVNSDFLCNHQEKQMAMQPDMILQFAHFLKKYYAAQGVYQPQVRAEVYATLNARPSRLLIDPELDLTTVQDGWRHRRWVLE